MAIEAGCLWFWHLKPRKKSGPEALCKQLADGKVPAELQELPVDEILAALQEQYRSLLLDRDARAGEVDIPEEQTAIEACWSSKHFVFTFYGDAWKQMDRVVELMQDSDWPAMTRVNERCTQFRSRRGSRARQTRKPFRRSGRR